MTDNNVTTAEAITALVDHGSIAGRIGRFEDFLTAALEANIRGALAMLEPVEALAFRLKQDDSPEELVRPGFGKYLKVMSGFMLGKDYYGQSIDINVTPVAFGAVEDTLAAFYTDEGVRQVFTEEFLTQLQEDSPVRMITSDNLTGRECVMDELKNCKYGEAACSLGLLLDTANGRQALSSLKIFFGSSAGPALAHQVAYAVGQTVRSAAFKTMVTEVAKRTGVANLLHPAIGSEVRTALSVCGINAARAPYLPVLAPILAVFRNKQYKNFPRRLAETLPRVAATAIKPHFSRLNRAVAQEICKRTLASFISNPYPV